MSGDTMADAYTLLGVTPGASELEVRRAYRRLARTLHPDLQPEHLREQSGRRLQAVNAARAQVLEEIRHRQAAATSPASPTIPQQRRSPEQDRERVEDLSRWVEHQEWLDLQRQHNQAWAAARASREQRRRDELLHDNARRGRRLRSGRRRAVVLLPILVVVQAAVAWGAVAGVEHVVSTVTTGQHAVPPSSDDLDLREMLALLGSWRS